MNLCRGGAGKGCLGREEARGAGIGAEAVEKNPLDVGYGCIPLGRPGTGATVHVVREGHDDVQALDLPYLAIVSLAKGFHQPPERCQTLLTSCASTNSLSTRRDTCTWFQWNSRGYSSFPFHFSPVRSPAISVFVLFPHSQTVSGDL